MKWSGFIFGFSFTQAVYCALVSPHRWAYVGICFVVAVISIIYVVRDLYRKETK